MTIMSVKQGGPPGCLIRTVQPVFKPVPLCSLRFSEENEFLTNSQHSHFHNLSNIRLHVFVGEVSSEEPSTHLHPETTRLPRPGRHPQGMFKKWSLPVGSQSRREMHDLHDLLNPPSR